MPKSDTHPRRTNRHPAQRSTAFPVGHRNRRRSKSADFLLLATALVLLLYAVDYILLGAQGVGYHWWLARRFMLDLVSWQVELYFWFILPLFLVTAYLNRNLLPIVDIPVMGAGAEEARLVSRWYRPGSFRIDGADATWIEAGQRAIINKRHIARRGILWGLQVIVPVERSVDPNGVVTYSEVSVAPYHSRILQERLRLELRQRAREERHRRLFGHLDDEEL